MADQETPGASAPDDGERAPDGGGVRGFIGRVLHGVTDAVTPPLEQAPTQPMTPPDEPPGQNAPQQPAEPGHDGPRQAFERWAVERFGVIFTERSRATGVSKGKPITHTPSGKRVKDPTRSAALINAARARHGIPVGKTMTEAEFDKLIDTTKSIEVR